MSWMRSIFPVAITLILPLALGGCAGALVVGGLAAAGGAGYEAAQERGVKGTFDDFAIKNNIQTAWMEIKPPLPANLSVTVYEGRVLLTGTAANPEAKREAYRIASSTPGVRTVYDEIELGPTEGTWAVAKDAWITARLRSELVLDSHIRSDNYTIDTENGSVFLIGSARTQRELDRATQIARYVPDVKRVVSYVEIRPGAPVMAQPGPPPAPANARLPDDPVAVPRAPVEVEKLPRG